MLNIVVLSGAGISKESGLETFRDLDGMWQEYDYNELASSVAIKNNPEKVLEFYNMRREKMWNANPNGAHLSLVELEKKFNVQIITQNVDDLHERAGSSNILHIHGELSKVRSMTNPDIIRTVEVGEQINMGDLAEDGQQLRPHIVLFGEAVPKMQDAIEITQSADIFIVIGTSLQVYPAAELIDFTKKDCEIYIIDPSIPNIKKKKNMFFISQKASIAIPSLVQKIISEHE
jgi:NAD-dependent deacetylase